MKSNTLNILTENGVTIKSIFELNFCYVISYSTVNRKLFQKLKLYNKGEGDHGINRLSYNERERKKEIRKENFTYRIPTKHHIFCNMLPPNYQKLQRGCFIF